MDELCQLNVEELTRLVDQSEQTSYFRYVRRWLYLHDGLYLLIVWLEHSIPLIQ